MSSYISMELRHKSIKSYSSKKKKEEQTFSMLKIVPSLNAQDQAKLRTAGFFFPEVSSLSGDSSDFHAPGCSWLT